MQDGVLLFLKLIFGGPAGFLQILHRGLPGTEGGQVALSAADAAGGPVGGKPVGFPLQTAPDRFVADQIVRGFFSAHNGLNARRGRGGTDRKSVV